MTLVIGLTGGIGSGKSTLASLFLEHGADIIDTDEIAHHLTKAGGDAITAIRATFGDDYIADDGALNRPKMRTLIFSDAVAKQQLETILHPLILEQTKAALQRLQAKPYVILVVPLLSESPAFQQLVQHVLVVDCSEEIQIARVVGCSRMTDKEVRAVIAQQTPRNKRLQIADDVIYNEAELGNLVEKVADLHIRYLSNN